MRSYKSIVMLSVMSVQAQVWGMDGKEVMSRSGNVAYYQGIDGKARVTMTIVDAGRRKRVRKFTILRRNSQHPGGDQQYFLLFRRPADIQKTAFLVWKNVNKSDDRWLYLPAMDMVKRISSGDARSSFVGSNYYYEDISGRKIEEDDHILLEETEHYYVVKSTPRSKERVEFGYYVSWIHKSSFIPVKTNYYDAQDVNYRSYETLKTANIQGMVTVLKSRMNDLLTGGYTVIEMSGVEYNLQLPRNIFSERYIRNAPAKYIN